MLEYKNPPKDAADSAANSADQCTDTRTWGVVSIRPHSMSDVD